MSSPPLRIQRNLEFLKRLNSSEDINILKENLKNASHEELLTLVEICFNLIKFRYILSKAQLNTLRIFAPTIRKIAKTRNRAKAEKLLISIQKKFYSRLLDPLFKKL